MFSPTPNTMVKFEKVNIFLRAEQVMLETGESLSSTEIFFYFLRNLHLVQVERLYKTEREVSIYI